jgi:hypothetical protein
MPEDVPQDAAVAVVFELVHGINPADQRYALKAAVGGDNLGDEPLTGFQVAVQAAEGNLLVALEPECLP